MKRTKDLPAAIDIAAHRKNKNYTRTEQRKRILWNTFKPGFRFSPRHLPSWRNAMLRMFGAEIASGVEIYPSADIYFPWNLRIGSNTTVGWSVRLYNLGAVSIGSDCLVSQHVHICAGSHDYSDQCLPLTKPSVTIGSGVWCAAEAFIGPGVNVGKNAIVGARASVFRDVPAGSIVGGNPARIIGQRNKT